MQKQRSKLITKFTKQVDDMYTYTYHCCMQKHKILEHFDIGEDFIIDDEFNDQLEESIVMIWRVWMMVKALRCWKKNELKSTQMMHMLQRLELRTLEGPKLMLSNVLERIASLM